MAEIDRSLIGKWGPEGSMRVEFGKIREFARLEALEPLRTAGKLGEGSRAADHAFEVVDSVARAHPVERTGPSAR